VYIAQAIRDIIPDIELYLKALDGNIFMYARVSVETYDNISDSTDPPRNPIEVMDEEGSETPWWGWLLVVMGLLLVMCCCCMCCFGFMYRYKKYEKTDQKSEEEVIEFTSHRNADNDTALVPYQIEGDSAIVQNRTAIFPYSRPQIEDQHRSRTLQIMPSKSYTESSNGSSEDNMICFPADATSAIAVQSAITFGMEPPSEHVSRREAFLALPPPSDDSQEASLALLSPPIERLQLGEGPSTRGGEQSFAMSVVPGPINQNPDTFEVYRDFENQSHAVHEPRGSHHRDRERSSASQPASVIRSVALVKDKDTNALVMYGDNECQALDAQEPSGIYYFDEQQSHTTQSQSYAVQEPRGIQGWDEVSSYATEPPPPLSYTQPHSIRSVGSSVVPRASKKEKKWRNKNNRNPSMPHLDEQQSYTNQSQSYIHESYAVQEARGMHGWEDEASSYATQPPLPPTYTQSLVAQPPTISSVGSSVVPGSPKKKKKGRNMWEDEASSYVTQHPPPSTQSFATQPPLAIRSVGSSVMPGGYKKKRKQKKAYMRTSSTPPVQITSQTADPDDYYYGHSSTFYV